MTIQTGSGGQPESGSRGQGKGKSLLISVAALQKQLAQGRVQLIDASYYLPEHGRNARAEYEAGHLPGARFLDLDEVSDKSSPLPNMLPSAEQFSSHMSGLGIDQDQLIIVYDNSPLHSSGRVWWMLRLFGAPKVMILDGGQPAWVAAGGALEEGVPEARSGNFPAVADFSPVVDAVAGAVADIDLVQQIVADHSRQLVDARSPARFSGAEPEARPNMRAGHIPGARNIPNSALFDADGKYQDAAALARVFADAGVDPKAPIVASCGSGVTAANLVVAATILGAETPMLYDGSWAEWGSRTDTKIATRDNG